MCFHEIVNESKKACISIALDTTEDDMCWHSNEDEDELEPHTESEF